VGIKKSVAKDMKTPKRPCGKIQGTKTHQPGAKKKVTEGEFNLYSKKKKTIRNVFVGPIKRQEGSKESPNREKKRIDKAKGDSHGGEGRRPGET